MPEDKKQVTVDELANMSVEERKEVAKTSQLQAIADLSNKGTPGDAQPDATPTKDEGNKDSDDSKGKTDWRAEYFKAEKKNKAVEEEKSAVEKLLENNTAALEALKAQTPKEPAELKQETTEDDSTAWMRDLWGNEKPEETPTPEAKPVANAVTPETIAKLLAEQKDSLKEELRKESAVDQGMATILPALQALFVDEDGDVNNKQVIEAATAIRKESLRTDYSPSEIARLMFSAEIEAKREAHIRAEATQSVKKEMILKLAEKGVDLATVGLAEPKPKSEAQKDSEAILQNFIDNPDAFND